MLTKNPDQGPNWSLSGGSDQSDDDSESSSSEEEAPAPHNADTNGGVDKSVAFRGKPVAAQGLDLLQPPLLDDVEKLAEKRRLKREKPKTGASRYPDHFILEYNKW